MPVFQILSGKLLQLITGASVRAVVLALTAVLVLTIARRASAQLQHAVLSAVLVSMVAMPLVTLVAPPIRVYGMPELNPQVTRVTAVRPVKIDYATDTMIQPLAVTPMPHKSSWRDVVVLVYLLVAIGLLVRLAIGLKLAGNLARRSATLRDTDANLALEEVARRQSARYPLPELLESAEVQVPCA